THLLDEISDPNLADLVQITLATLNRALSWLGEARSKDESILEAGARRFALTIGRTMELALLIRHAQWARDHDNDLRPTIAAHRFAHSGIDLIVDHSFDDARTLRADAT